MTATDKPNPALYVHIPFCLSRCSYCAFATGLYRSELADSYLFALETELSRRNLFSPFVKPATLFIGGGTPTSLSLKQMERLFSLLPFPESGGETTCEINPDSLDSDKLYLMRQFGINRCSLGVQTFSDDGLILLNRRHDARIAQEKVAMAVAGGFASVSLDLISGWPGQSEKGLEADLRKAVELGVNHLSCYNLMLEEGSSLRRTMDKRGLKEKNEDEMRRFWDLTESVLEEAGFIHYETSNFARPGFACRHNTNIWKGKDYLGAGSSAHSYIRGRRFANHGDACSYISMIKEKGEAEVFSESLGPESRARECAVFWLRLFEGMDCGEFLERTGFDFMALYSTILPQFVEDKILEIDKNPDGGVLVRVKKEMHPVLDAILVDLI